MITLFCMIVTFQITYVYCTHRANISVYGHSAYDSEKLAFVDRLYRENFVEEIDGQVLTDTLIHAYLAGAGERFGSYLDEEQLSLYFDSMEGSLVGIGVTVIYDEEANAIEIVEVQPDSPAENAGLTPGERIIAVDFLTVAEDGYEAVVDAVAGEEGSTLTMTVSAADGTERELTVTRAQVEITSVYARMHESEPVGVIRITGFNTATVEQFKTALADLQEQGAQGFVFDLRDNPGGELNSVTSILDIILPEGDIIISYDKDGNRRVDATSDASELDVPMAVLINENSASASELFAGNIRHYEKGVLVGENTFGKGTMQELVLLGDGTGISMTNYKFACASGECHDGVGFAPDIEVALSEDVKDENLFTITDAQDNVLAEALKYITGELSK